jgi:hypothetical protein
MTNQSEGITRKIKMAAAMALLVAVIVPAGSGPRGPALVATGSGLAAPAANVIYRSGPVVDSPSITIAGATVSSSSTPTTAAREAHVIWVFGTVSGTYTSCTAQAQMAPDGATFLNLGGTAALTVTSGAVNAWDIYQQAPVTTGVTVTAPSSTAATGFGQLTNFKFACTGYGTSASVTVTVIYR